jgi:hypothetical protein
MMTTAVEKMYTDEASPYHRMSRDGNAVVARVNQLRKWCSVFRFGADKLKTNGATAIIVGALRKLPPAATAWPRKSPALRRGRLSPRHSTGSLWAAASRS